MFGEREGDRKRDERHQDAPPEVAGVDVVVDDEPEAAVRDREDLRAEVGADREHERACTRRRGEVERPPVRVPRVHRTPRIGFRSLTLEESHRESILEA